MRFGSELAGRRLWGEARAKIMAGVGLSLSTNAVVSRVKVGKISIAFHVSNKVHAKTECVNIANTVCLHVIRKLTDYFAT